MPRNHSFFYRNSLSIVFTLLFLASFIGQILTGWYEYNQELTSDNAVSVSLPAYFTSGHFVEATFENWESEFLQMFSFIWLTIFLRQKGSAESKDLDKKEEVDRDPVPHENAPWPVKKGGLWLSIYKHSLSLIFLLLFFISMIFHFQGSLCDYNEQQRLEGKPLSSTTSFLGSTKFWFESFQNWQSEFLSVLGMVVFTIYLRQQGSPESKPVDAPSDETGK